MDNFKDVKKQISQIIKTFKHLNGGLIEERGDVYRLYLEPQGFSRDEALSKARAAYRLINKLLKANDCKYVRFEELTPVVCGQYPDLLRYRLNIYYSC